jgi:hypothetical protein
MAHKGPANPAAREPKVKRHFDWARLFKGRHLGYVSHIDFLEGTELIAAHHLDLDILYRCRSARSHLPADPPTWRTEHLRLPRKGVRTRHGTSPIHRHLRFAHLHLPLGLWCSSLHCSLHRELSSNLRKITKSLTI